MPSQPAPNLSSLSLHFPLPVSDVSLETFSDVTHVSGIPIHLAGFAADFDGECITGSAAALDEAPFFRAYMELLERLSIVLSMLQGEPLTLRDAEGARVGLAPPSHVFPQSPDTAKWKWARSNGVALATTWAEAARRARWELLERDRVLRSFYGEFAPTRVDGVAALPPALAGDYEVASFLFDPPFPDGVHAAGVFAFPRGDGPLVFGFGARDERNDSIASAAGECLQRLGFLAGEELPAAPPVASPTPDFHQEHYLYAGHHERLRKWLDGEHEKYRGCLNDLYSGVPEEPRYADLTPRALEGRLCVARALPSGHVPLAFGVELPFLASAAPTEVAVHPIA